MGNLRIPLSTYRLQFNKGFRFEDALTILPYLERLGISDLYASPILKARQGSPHGYDVTDPSCLNPELGTETDFEQLSDESRGRGMGLILDIVPNHMAIGPENQWWTDVLENGLASPFADFFDIDWQQASDVSTGKVLLPILGAPLSEVLEARQLRLVLEDDCLFIRYYETSLPIDIKSYSLVFSQLCNGLQNGQSSNHSVSVQLKKMLNAMESLPGHSGPNTMAMKRSYLQRQRLKREFRHMVGASPELRALILEKLALFNEAKLASGTEWCIEGLLERQAYRLAFWRTGIRDINYRRFFDINDLIGVRVEQPKVFRETHSLITRLAHEGKVTGLRVDHVDGLRDPQEYLRRLKAHLLPKGVKSPRLHSCFVVVEKIFMGEEPLPLSWPVSGTTGYDFLGAVGNVFVNPQGFQVLEDNYRRLTGCTATFDDTVYAKKKQVMEELFTSEIKMLGYRLAYLVECTHGSGTLSKQDAVDCLVEATACLPVYRTYIRTYNVSTEDSVYLKQAFERARRRGPPMGHRALEFLERVLLLDFPGSFGKPEKDRWLAFVMRWQQFTGAVMAKGLEDTALYEYNPLISLNDVGTKPVPPDSPVESFHKSNLKRLSHFPHTLNATSTHDTKRSEDVRSRISVISEMPEIWNQHLTRWMQFNQQKKQRVDGCPVPDAAMEILLYQTLVGAWPLSQEDLPSFRERIDSFILKAAREARKLTSWLSPDVQYEDALIKFTRSILESPEENEFLIDFLEFQRKTAYYGALNSIAQTLLKITSPGVPDFYQGTELWDFSLVDPDNRRPVDFKIRSRLLDELLRHETEGLPSLVRDLLSNWEDGRIKLYTTYRALNARKSYRDLFLNGDYVPVQVHGEKKEHICAFTRSKGDCWALVAVPRLLTKLVSVNQLPVGQDVWGNEHITLPEGAPGHWRNIFTGERVTLTSPAGALPVSQVIGIFPVALLISDPLPAK